MEKAEPAAATTVVKATSDFTQKNLARRLVFTPNCNASVNAILPEHPQARLQSKLVALAQAQAQSQSQPQPVAQWQLKPQPQVQPRPKELVPRVQPVAHPVQSPSRPTFQVLKTHSPKSRPSCKVELKGATPKKRKCCNCRNSLCLKLYCECFASGISCDGCNCTNCHNNTENEAARQEALGATLERSRKAFRSKIAITSPHGSHDDRIQEEAGEIMLLGKHNKGCNCKKSGCLKRYCECFQAGTLCSESCKCMDCKNYEGSEERKSLFHEDQANVMTYIQQAANAAINGATKNCGFGTISPNKKRRIPQLAFGSTPTCQSYNKSAGFQEENHIVCAGAFSPLPSVRQSGAATSTLLRNSNFRSLLAGVIRPQDVNELCSLLVEVSGEAAKTHAEKNHVMNEQVEMAQTDSLVASTTQQSRDGKNKDDAPQTSGNHIDRVEINTCDESDEVDLQNEMALSPRTLSLMCDEDDIIFTEEGVGDSPYVKKDFSDIYAEQEKLVLTRFWECLNRIIACGSIKEAMHSSSLAKTETRSELDQTKNGHQ